MKKVHLTCLETLKNILSLIPELTFLVNCDEVMTYIGRVFVEQSVKSLLLNFGPNVYRLILLYQNLLLSSAVHVYVSS